MTAAREVLVTGADGFVGRHLVRRLRQSGDEVAAACRPGGAPVDWSVGAGRRCRSSVLPLEMLPAESVGRRPRLGSRRDRPSRRRGVGARGRPRPGPGLGDQRGRHGPARGRRGAPGPEPRSDAAAGLDRRGVRRRPWRAAAWKRTRCCRSRPTPRARSAPRRRCSRPGAGPACRVVIARPFPHTGPGTDAGSSCRPSPSGCGRRRRSGGRDGAHRQPGTGPRPARRPRRGRRLPAAAAARDAGRGVQRRQRRRHLAARTCSAGSPTMIGVRRRAGHRPGAGPHERHPASRGRFD